MLHWIYTHEKSYCLHRYVRRSNKLFGITTHNKDMKQMLTKHSRADLGFGQYKNDSRKIMTG